MVDITRRKNLNHRRHRSYPRVVKGARHSSYRVQGPAITAPGTTGRPRSSWPIFARTLSQHDQHEGLQKMTRAETRVRKAAWLP